MATHPEPAPLRIYATTVAPEWIDYNGHMTEGAYGWAFADASDQLLIHLGFGPEYRLQERGSFYTVETHLRFRRELTVGDPLAFETTLLGADPKRLHLYQRMLHADAGFVAATHESMLLHVDLDHGTVRPMGQALWDRVRDLAAAHRDLPRADDVGRSIRPRAPGAGP